MTGDELRALRKRAGLTALKLGQEVGLSATTISRYECGHALIPKAVELAARYVCAEHSPPTDAPERLAQAIRDVVGHG